MSAATDEVTQLIADLAVKGQGVSNLRAQLKAAELDYSNTRNGFNTAVLKLQEEAGEIDKAQADVLAVDQATAVNV